MVEKIILVLALIGSIGWIIDKAILLIRRPDNGLRQRDEQIARLLQEIKLQKERMDEEVSKLTDQLRQRDAEIIDLHGRLKVAEIQMAAHHEDAADRNPGQQEIELTPVDPVAAICKEAEAQAQACKADAMRMAFAAAGATGREKSRLYAEAKALLSKAAEYRAIADGSIFETVKRPGNAMAPVRQPKRQQRAKPGTKSSMSEDLVLAGNYEVVD